MHFSYIATLSFLILLGGVYLVTSTSEKTEPELEVCKPKRLSCEFYSCLQKKYNCTGPAAYPMRYGMPYCRLMMSHYHDLDMDDDWKDKESWKNWTRETIFCIQTKLEPLANRRCIVSCGDLRKYALESHSRCHSPRDPVIGPLKFRSKKSCYRDTD